MKLQLILLDDLFYRGTPGTGNTTSTSNLYETTLGIGASTTGNIYGIYDMSGGSHEYVMGISNKTIGSSGFSSLPDEKYYNNYTSSSYTGHALTETSGWYNDYLSFVTTSSSWMFRGGYYSDTTQAGVFQFNVGNGASQSFGSTRMVVTNE